MSQVENATQNNNETIQLVVFELDKEEYAVEIKDLQEIITIPEITPIPNAPKFIKGILNLRGKISVVVDLEKRFNLIREHENKNDGNIVITEVEENSFGLIVDRVNEIITVPLSSIQATPALVSSKIEAEYLKGVVVVVDQNKDQKKGETKGSRLIILLDIKKMLKEKELLQLGKNVKKVGDIK